MQSKTPKLGILGVILIIVAAGGWIFLSESAKDHKSQETLHKAVFVCAGGKSIRATFLSHSVQLALSDGRKLNLDRAVSASGARYADSDESVVFWNKGNTAFVTEGDSTTFSHCVVKGEDDLVNLKLFEDNDSSFVFRYPRAFQKYRASVADTSGWSYASTEKGKLAVQLKLDSSFQPKTNFSEATLSVGWSEHPKALSKCLESPVGRIIKSDTLVQNKTQFVRSKYAEAGAGNFYQVIQYRTLKNNRCYSIEEMVHSTNIHNYPPERGITEFDSARVWKILNTARNTFSFNE